MPEQEYLWYHGRTECVFFIPCFFIGITGENQVLLKRYIISFLKDMMGNIAMNMMNRDRPEVSG